MERKILLIGGAGYIGLTVTEHLLANGYKVRCYDNLLYGHNSLVLPYISRPNYEFVHGDIRDERALTDSLLGITDAVILAGMVGDPITRKYPELSDAINFDGMIRCIATMNGTGLDRVIFVSTCSNYGLQSNDKLSDEGSTLNPLSSYAKAKVAAETYILSNKNKVDYCPTILRFATAFGLAPRMRFDLTVNEFTRDLALGKELLVFDPNTWRPYCHVKDFANLIGIVLNAPEAKVKFEVFNSGGDINNYTKKGIIDVLTKHLPNAKIKYQDHGSDPRNYRVDFSKVKHTLGFLPNYSIEDGVFELLNSLESKLLDHVDQNHSFFGNYEVSYKS